MKQVNSVPIKSRSTALAIALLNAFSFGGFSVPTLAHHSPSTTVSQTPPAPPRTPPPNRTRPGGGLNPLTTCSASNEELRALIPVENPVLTISEHPTFYFYVPFGANEVKGGEFSLLLWPDEHQRLYKTTFTLPEQPGIVSITLPSLPNYALEEGQIYRWYFHLYCESGVGDQPDLSMDGSIQRVESTPERDRQIQAATLDIWYDTLATVIDGLQTTSQAAQAQDAWRNLLQAIDAENLVDIPYVGSVIPTDVDLP